MRAKAADHIFQTPGSSAGKPMLTGKMMRRRLPDNAENVKLNLGFWSGQRRSVPTSWCSRGQCRYAPKIELAVAGCYRYRLSLHITHKGQLEIRFHPHALERLAERGTNEEEVRAAMEGGERFPAKHGRTGFRRNFPFNGEWSGKHYAVKQIEAYAVEENGWLVITVIVKFF